MGRLGWPPREAMAADVNAIELALVARGEAEIDLQIWLFRAAGYKVPSRQELKRKKAKPTPADFRAFAAEQNAIMRQKGKLPRQRS